jgi:hypothetical protein
VRARLYSVTLVVHRVKRTVRLDRTTKATTNAVDVTFFSLCVCLLGSIRIERK